MNDFYSDPAPPRVAVADPYGDVAGPGQTFSVGAVPALMPAVAHSATDRATGDIVTAQRVAVKRDLPRILREIDETATVAGPNFYYSWATKNSDGTQGVVEGPSIDCAMALVNIWGNCRIEAFPATETNTHWVFLARFTDFEKGVTVVRSFQQRRNQRAGGKMNADRMEDIAFQIGQSKAMRNAIVAGLKVFADRAVRAAKASAYAWVLNNIDKARSVVLDQAHGLRVPVGRMEKATGRKSGAWLAEDLVQLRSKLQSIADGFDDVDTAFPAADEEENPPQETGPVKPPADEPKQEDERKQRRQRKEKADVAPERQTTQAGGSPSAQVETAQEAPSAQAGGAGAHVPPADPDPPADDGFGSLRFE